MDGKKNRGVEAQHDPFRNCHHAEEYKQSLLDQASLGPHLVLTGANKLPGGNCKQDSITRALSPPVVPSSTES